MVNEEEEEEEEEADLDYIVTKIKELRDLDYCDEDIMGGLRLKSSITRLWIYESTPMAANDEDERVQGNEVEGELEDGLGGNGDEEVQGEEVADGPVQQWHVGQERRRPSERIILQKQRRWLTLLV
ncbi:hypothetical protein LXL04_032999 [Taraxacum kok-saghyz]